MGLQNSSLSFCLPFPPHTIHLALGFPRAGIGVWAKDKRQMAADVSLLASLSLSPEGRIGICCPRRAQSPDVSECSQVRRKILLTCVLNTAGLRPPGPPRSTGKQMFGRCLTGSWSFFTQILTLDWLPASFLPTWSPYKRSLPFSSGCFYSPPAEFFLQPELCFPLCEGVRFVLFSH